MLSSSSFRDAIERAGRYKQLMCPEEIRLIGRGRELRLQFRFPLKRELVPTVLQDLCFAWIVAIGRRGTGQALSPLRVELSRPSVDRRGYEEYFGCAVELDASADSLVFDPADLDRPFQTHNAELLAMIAPQLDAELAHRRADQSAADRAKVTVKRLLAGRRPDLRDVARELGVSTRTLQRRLADAGLTFQQILEGARRELAHHYLLHSGARPDRDRLRARLRGRELVLPRVPAVGGRLARPLARASPGGSGRARQLPASAGLSRASQSTLRVSTTCSAPGLVRCCVHV